MNMKKIVVSILVCVCLFFAGCKYVEEEPLSRFIDDTTRSVEPEIVEDSNNIVTIDSVELLTYEGEAYIEVNNNIPLFSNAEKESLKSFEVYSDLDELGRCGVAYALVSKDTMPEEERTAIGDIRPSGWHTVNYHGIVEDNYLYNRCHLIGYQLTGQNDNEKNLITGTRYLNIEGMLPFESKVAEYVESTGNHVLYRVTPVFKGDNLVSSGVLMEAFSVEDAGTGICFNVFCFNVQPGIDIDYTSGESAVSKDAVEEVTDVYGDDYDFQNASEGEEVKNCDYVVNINTKRFHKPTCPSVQDMKKKNAEYYSGDRQELISQGYKPCGSCKP